MKHTTSASPSSPIQAALYIRVSTDEQADHGVSLDAQETRLRAYCELRGLDVAAVVCDAGVSGGKPLARREGGQQILKLIQRKRIQAVVAFKLDRLFRNCVDALETTEQWDKRGVALHPVDLRGQTLDTSSPMGRFFLTIMAGAAELERGLVAERTRTAMGYKRSLGQRIGDVPYGYALAADGVTLLPDQGEQALIEAVREARRRGLTQRGIVSELARQGFTTRKGTTIQLRQVQRILKAHAA